MWLLKNDQHMICSDPLEKQWYKQEINIKGTTRQSIGLDHTSKELTDVWGNNFQAPYISLWIIFTRNMNSNPCLDSSVSLTVQWSRNPLTWHVTVSEKRKNLQVEAATEINLSSTLFFSPEGLSSCLKFHNSHWCFSFGVLRSTSMSPGDMNSDEELWNCQGYPNHAAKSMKQCKCKKSNVSTGVNLFCLRHEVCVLSNLTYFNPILIWQNKMNQVKQKKQKKTKKTTVFPSNKIAIHSSAITQDSCP